MAPEMSGFFNWLPLDLYLIDFQWAYAIPQLLEFSKKKNIFIDTSFGQKFANVLHIWSKKHEATVISYCNQNI